MNHKEMLTDCGKSPDNLVIATRNILGVKVKEAVVGNNSGGKGINHKKSH